MEIRNTLILDGEEPLSKAMNEMLRTGFPVIIMNSREYCGIIDDRTISHGVTDASRVKCVNACVNAPILYSSSALLDRLNAFLSGHFKALPVFDHNTDKPLGITTRVDLLKDFLHTGMFPRANVSEMMAMPAYTIDYDATLGEAKNLMKMHGCHRLVAVRNGYPAGVLSTFDLSATLTKPKGRKGNRLMRDIIKSDEKHVSDLLSEALVSVEQDTPIEQVLRKMVEKQISTILVISNKKPVGIFSAFDLFKKLMELSKEKEESITISGLGEDEMLHYNEVRDTIKKVTDKFSKSLEIRSVSVHFKKGKSVYKGNIYLELKKDHVALSAEDFDFKTTLNALAAELYTVLNKRKSILKQRKGKRRVER